MPRTKTSGRGANGNGTIRKVERTINEKKYIYWQGRFTVGYDLGTGKQIQKCITGKTQKEVAQKLKEMTLDVDNGVYQEPTKMTFGQWLDIWIAEYMGDKKYLTIKNYEVTVRAHIKPSLGAVKLSQLNPVLIQKFYNDLLDHGQLIPQRDKRGRIVKRNGQKVMLPAPMAPKTVRNIHGVVTKALAVAVSIGYLRDNPADRVTLPRVERKELNPLSDRDVGNFLEIVKTDPLSNIMQVILFTGLRESDSHGIALISKRARSKSVNSFKRGR